MQYTAVIRTLGTAGEKYQTLLNSLVAQTIQPSEIIVYIAEGYPIPKETVGVEQYIYVKKGMVAQRALRYDEVHTEWMLFLDDDVYLPADGVELLHKHAIANGADVVSPNTFENHKMGLKTKILNILLGQAVPFKSNYWAYTMLRTGGFGYNNNPINDFYWSESNAGPCFLCKKSTFNSIEFEKELWLDKTPYALPEDQVMFYKMHLKGYKVATVFHTGIIHLDAGATVGNMPNRLEKVLYSEVKNQIIFWHKFIKPYNKGIMRIWAWMCIAHYVCMRRIFALRHYLMGDKTHWLTVNRAIADVKSQIKQL